MLASFNIYGLLDFKDESLTRTGSDEFKLQLLGEADALHKRISASGTSLTSGPAKLIPDP